MKKNLQSLLVGLGMTGALSAQVTGPSSSQSPYLTPLVSGYSVTSILTATDVVGGYTMCGTPDGTGIFDNNDGTFTLLMNHEFGATAGTVHAHGAAGTFVSKWVINKTTKAVVSGADLIQNLNLWNGSSYVTYNSTSPSTLAAMARFCSGDLAPVTAYYNAANGKGTQARIFLNGEENGNEGRAFGHIASGSAAGNSYELPYLGKLSYENAVASPYMSDKTIVASTDDQTPGQVYIYIGTKTNTGLDIDKAGLTNGKVYGISVSGYLTETNTMVPAANTTFSLVDLGQVNAITGASLNTMSNNLGVTNFLRPEDGCWNPSNPREFYFVTTNSFSSPSRLWRLSFTDINNPENGGTITAVLDGTEGQKMLDNMTIDNSGHIYLQEDVGNNAHNGKIWIYDIATDVATQVFEHDQTRFITGGANFLTQDEEASGVIDAQAILGAGWFLAVDQAHYSIPGQVVEGGQILTFYSPATFSSNPEANVQGNANNISDGSVATTTTNNTNYGTVNVGSNASKAFVIQNTGTGTLVVNGITFMGANASEFVITGSPITYPINLAPGASYTINVQFTPAAAGTRSANINIWNNDFDENWYDFVVQGSGNIATGIDNNVSVVNSINVYPNPTRDEATLSVTLEKAAQAVVEIYDLQGKKVTDAMQKDLVIGENKIALNTTDLKNGVYFVQLTVNGKTTSTKLIVKK